MPRKPPLDPAVMDPRVGVDHVMDDANQICWFPVRHYSPVAAMHVRSVIQMLQPGAVLVEGPDDATAHIDALVDPGTEPPLSILSTWVDKKNIHGLNGQLTPSLDVPVRYRGWWPFVRYSPEYQALLAGRDCGAELGFIDAPLRATLPYQQARRRRTTQAVNDRALAESAYFQALGRTGRTPDFASFWDGMFEVRGAHTDPLEWMRAVLLFAWCTRHVGTPDAFQYDGTLLREQHMRWHVDQVRKRTKGWVVVVTGAFHSVALPFTKGKRAKDKADRQTTTLLCAHSYPALARLYSQNQQPAYGDEVWLALTSGDERPHGTAARRMLVDVMRAARDQGFALSTADAVGAWRSANELARLRERSEPTRSDVADAILLSYVKGDEATAGKLLEPIAERVLIGQAIGRVTEHAGQIALISNFYQDAKSHRLNLSGEHKIVRCDLGRSLAHRRKSAFLHQALWLEVPMFASHDRARLGEDVVRGPDPVTGENLHLLTEAWGVQWSEEVDDRLVELADRGPTLSAVASNKMEDDIRASRGDAATRTRLLLHTAQMMLLDLFPSVLKAVDGALHDDHRFLALTEALNDLLVLYELRQGLATHGVDGMLHTFARTWHHAVLQIHQLAHLEEDEVEAGLRGLVDVVRLVAGFEAVELDRRLLVERLEVLAANRSCPPRVQGAVLGALYGLGHRRDADIAKGLELALAGSDRAALGAFLEGLFQVGRAVLLRGDRLLAAVDDVVAQLSWDEFESLLPDLRRAFTQFIPSELHELGQRVRGRLAGKGTDLPPAIPEGLRILVAEADARALESIGPVSIGPVPSRLERS